MHAGIFIPFFKIPIIHSKKYSFFWKRPYRPGLSTYGDGGGGLPYEPNLESSIRRHPFRKEMKMKWRNSGTTVSRLICCFYFARKSGHTQRKGEGPSWRLTLPTFFEILSFVVPTRYWVYYYFLLSFLPFFVCTILCSTSTASFQILSFLLDDLFVIYMFHPIWSGCSFKVVRNDRDDRENKE